MILFRELSRSTYYTDRNQDDDHEEFMDYYDMGEMSSVQDEEKVPKTTKGRGKQRGKGRGRGRGNHHLTVESIRRNFVG